MSQCKKPLYCGFCSFTIFSVIFMRLNLLLATLFLSFSFMAQSAQLRADLGVDFLVINGAKVEKFGKGSRKHIELDEGKYQLVARYVNTLKRGSKRTLFTSKPYVFELDIKQEDLLLSVPLMRTETQAAAFFRNPKWQLTKESDQSTEIIPSKLLEGHGFAPYSDMEKAVALHNEKKQPVGALKPLLIPTKEVKETLNTATKQDSLVQLKYWYQKASTEEKKAFRHWILDQP